MSIVENNKEVIYVSAQRVIELCPDMVAKHLITSVGIGLIFPLPDGANVHAEPNLDRSWTLTYTDALGHSSMTVNNAPQEQHEISLFTFGANQGLEGAHREYAHTLLHEMKDFAEMREHVKRYACLQENVSALSFESVSGTSSFQAEGTLLDMNFYFHYRANKASLTLAKSKKEIFTKPLWQSSTSYQKAWNGLLNVAQFQELFISLIKSLEKAPMRWRFESTPEFGGRISHYETWGYSAQEAWENLEREKSEDEEWAQQLDKLALNSQTVSIDDRDLSVHPRTALNS